MTASRPHWFVYMLRCVDGTIYTGITNNVAARLKKHNAGRGAKYTKQRTPVSLIFREKHPDQGSAMRRELQIKKWSRLSKEKLAAKRTRRAT